MPRGGNGRSHRQADRPGKTGRRGAPQRENIGGTSISRLTKPNTPMLSGILEVTFAASCALGCYDRALGHIYMEKRI